MDLVNLTRLKLIWVTVCVVGFGCSGFERVPHPLVRDYTQFGPLRYEHRKWHRVKKLAKETWHEIARCNGRYAFSADYQQGFQDGFADQLYYGGPIRPPVMPPRNYWQNDYRNPAGHMAAEHWFRGFQDGAIAAQSSVGHHWETVPMALFAQQVAERYQVNPHVIEVQEVEAEEVPEPTVPEPTPSAKPRSASPEMASMPARPQAPLRIQAATKPPRPVAQKQLPVASPRQTPTPDPAPQAAPVPTAQAKKLVEKPKVVVQPRARVVQQPRAVAQPRPQAAKQPSQQPKLPVPTTVSPAPQVAKAPQPIRAQAPEATVPQTPDVTTRPAVKPLPSVLVHRPSSKPAKLPPVKIKPAPRQAKIVAKQPTPKGQVPAKPKAKVATQAKTATKPKAVVATRPKAPAKQPLLGKPQAATKKVASRDPLRMLPQPRKVLPEPKRPPLALQQRPKAQHPKQTTQPVVQRKQQPAKPRLQRSKPQLVQKSTKPAALKQKHQPSLGKPAHRLANEAVRAKIAKRARAAKQAQAKRQPSNLAQKLDESLATFLAPLGKRSVKQVKPVSAKQPIRQPKSAKQVSSKKTSPVRAMDRLELQGDVPRYTPQHKYK